MLGTSQLPKHPLSLKMPGMWAVTGRQIADSMASGSEQHLRLQLSLTLAFLYTETPRPSGSTLLSALVWNLAVSQLSSSDSRDVESGGRSASLQ